MEFIKKNDLKKKPFYLSIDFEDFYYNSLRDLKCKNPKTKEAALIKSYERIKYICKKYLDDKKITFFVTGIVTKKVPKLIKEIYDDGHEISCHYNFHDNISESNREDFAHNLDEAIEIIKNVIGEKPLGFRAPNFAISPSNTWAYEELCSRFLYDSSYRTSLNITELKEQKIFHHKNYKLEEFFVYGKPIFKNLFNIRSGGTFLRLFPSSLIISSMQESYNKGHIPLLYLHPYELTLNHDFWIPWKDLNFLPLMKKIYIYCRQTQWSHLGHQNLENKINHICDHFEHQGPMKNLVLNS